MIVIVFASLKHSHPVLANRKYFRIVFIGLARAMAMCTTIGIVDHWHHWKFAIG